MKLGSVLLALFAASAAIGAQEPANTAAQHVTPSQAIDSAAAHASTVTAGEIHQGATPTGAAAHHVEGCEEFAPGDFITPHITDSHCIDVPGFPAFWEVHEVALPRWKPIMVGGVSIDMSPTKHVVFMLLGAVIVLALMTIAAAGHSRTSKAVGHPKGFSNMMEAVVLYVRNEVALPNVGPHGEKFAPFILTLFFFILVLNLLGLIPFGSTATGNVSVTAALAIVTFFVVEIAGIRSQGLAYLKTIFYWNNELPVIMRPLMFVILTPIEVLSKLTKPFALTIRLFANMTAGHIVVLALIGLVFAFKSYMIGTAPLLAAVAIMCLELFVAFLQAFIFALLSSVFIGLIREHH
jgi:F-type H+-transporting ATPase subunit a